MKSGVWPAFRNQKGKFMKENLTYIIFVVDRSGSMSSICKDMIGGFNAFIKKQKLVPGDCKVFFYQFNTEYNTVYTALDLNRVPDLTDKTYVPQGGTALYPSLGMTIENIGKMLANTSEDDRPGKVLFVTITDGEDNSILWKIDGIIASHDFHQFRCDQVKSMIEHQTQVYNWDFAYIGANQDAWAVGSSMGVANNLNYVASSKGVEDMFDNLEKSTATYRSSKDKVSFKFEAEKSV